jgi:hypothetical protein
MPRGVDGISLHLTTFNAVADFLCAGVVTGKKPPATVSVSDDDLTIVHGLHVRGAPCATSRSASSRKRDAGLATPGGSIGYYNLTHKDAPVVLVPGDGTIPVVAAETISK